MSFIAKFRVEGEELTVLHCGFRLSQAVDSTGKPIAIPQGGTIDLTLESTNEATLFDWMANPTQIKDGNVTFYRRDNMSKLKTLTFSQAYCIDYYETFDHEGRQPMQIQLRLSAKEIKLNDSGFKNNWPS